MVLSLFIRWMRRKMLKNKNGALLQVLYGKQNSYFLSSPQAQNTLSASDNSQGHQ